MFSSTYITFQSADLGSQKGSHCSSGPRLRRGFGGVTPFAFPSSGSVITASTTRVTGMICGAEEPRQIGLVGTCSHLGTSRSAAKTEAQNLSAGLANGGRDHSTLKRFTHR